MTSKCSRCSARQASAPSPTATACMPRRFRSSGRRGAVLPRRRSTTRQRAVMRYRAAAGGGMGAGVSRGGARIAQQLDRKGCAATVCLGGLGIEPDCGHRGRAQSRNRSRAESVPFPRLRCEERIEAFSPRCRAGCRGPCRPSGGALILARGRRADRDGPAAGEPVKACLRHLSGD